MRWTRALRAGTAFLLGALAAAPSLSAQETLSLWHTQGDENGALLSAIIAEYNAADPPMRVEAVFKGGYDQIFHATRTNLIARIPPDMAVAYESMVLEYMELGGVLDLDAFLNDPEIGLTAEEADDFFPAFLELNRYPERDNALLSFAFTKSLMTLYANHNLLAEAGFDAPAETWEEFFEQCAAVKARLGKEGYAISIDASTLDGMFLSRGARLYDPVEQTPLFEDEAVVETLAYLRRLYEAGGLYIADRQNEEDTRMFVRGDTAFFIRSSTRRPMLQTEIADRFRWSMNPLPAAGGRERMTILYGGNICVFPTGEERMRAAWHFIRYFCSPDVTARWALGSGYVPVRRSAATRPVMQAWFAENPINRQVFDMIPLARREPAPRGWQQVRGAIERAALDAILGRSGGSAERLAAKLQQDASGILASPESRPSRKGTTFFFIGAIVAVAVGLTLVRRRARRL